LNKSFTIFKYFVALDRGPYPVVKVYDALTSVRSTDTRITKQDVNHILTLLRKSSIIAKNRRRGGLLVLIPHLFFELSYRYAHTADIGAEDFILKRLNAEGISWCFNDLMSFIKSYGDVITEFFALTDVVFSKHETSFRAATLLLISSTTIPEPYSWIIPNVKSSLFEEMELLEKGLKTIYRDLKTRIVSLTSGKYQNPVYINARNIATAILFYVLLSKGVERILHYHYSEKPDPHLSLLFSLNEEYIGQYDNFVKHLSSLRGTRRT